jgi:hypothetical protein
MKTLIYFAFYFCSFTPDGEHEGQTTYKFIFKGKVYDHVYQEEIKNAIKTGEFKYNEDWTFKTI